MKFNAELPPGARPPTARRTPSSYAARNGDVLLEVAARVGGAYIASSGAASGSTSGASGLRLEWRSRAASV